jgi:hypothetical protein
MAGQTTLAGPDASFTGLSGQGCKFNAFSIGVTQSTMESVGFGETDAEVRGGVRRATITASGVTTKGSASDKFGIGGMVQAAASITLLFFTGCTLAMAVVNSGIGATVQLEAFDQSTYSYVKSGAITETWVVS